MPSHEVTTNELLDFLKENVAMKEDLIHFATKDDLKTFATKDDLKDLREEVQEVKSEMHEMKADLQEVKSEMREMKTEIIDTIDGFIGNQQKFDVELASVRYRVSDHEERLTRVEKS
ncbi:MAG: hypothetical protein NUV81_03500 [bacterium]|nr:hypothetical protein [bacterium]